MRALDVMAISSHPSMKLRRSAWSVVMTSPFGPLLPFVTALIVPVAVSEPDGFLAVVALGCMGLWSVGLWRVVHLDSGHLVYRSPLFGSESLPIEAIKLIEVGRQRVTAFPGYSGFVLAVETSSRRFVVPASRYNGIDRLSNWAAKIETCPGYRGECRVVRSQIRGGGRPEAVSG